MTLSTWFQVLGSLCVFIGYWLNSKNHPRQHMLFIFGHLFLIAFSLVEEKWVLVALSVFVIYMQYRISTKKWKFKKDIVRVKKVANSIKPKESPIVIIKKIHENKGVLKKDRKAGRDLRKKSHVVQGSKG